MTSGRAIWINVQAVTVAFISLVLFAGVVHLTNGDPGQAFENTIVASAMAGAILLGRFVERRVAEHQRIEGLRQRFDAEVAAELAEAEKWHANKLYEERQAAALAERVRRWEAHLPGAKEAEEMAYAEQEARNTPKDPQVLVEEMRERRRQTRSRSERGFGRYLEQPVSGDQSPERIRAAEAANQMAIVADQLGGNFSTLAQHQRDLILRPMTGALTGPMFPYDAFAEVGWISKEPDPAKPHYQSITNDKGELEVVQYDPTTGELGYSG